MSFGKRSLEPLSHWEGEVEEVTDSGFRARLVPSEGHPGSMATTEYTEFSFDDLADESDIDFVSEGAVFYWTIGRGKNSAGQRTNVSLVRFRRLAPPSAQRQREARHEAARLLQELGGPE
jgi:hypothetical protein